MFSGIGGWEIVVVLAIVLVIFGGGKLAGVGKSLGQGLREFKQAITGAEEEKPTSDDNPPTPKTD